MEIKVNSLGLVVVILAKNLSAFESILKVYGNIMYTLENDIVGGVLLSAVK